MTDTHDYEEIKAEAMALYGQANTVYCPALASEVTLNAGGFKHFIHKGRHIERDKRVQIARFKLLPQALHLIKITTTHQEYEERLQEFGKMDHKRRRKEKRIVKFWGLIAIIDDRKIKVVIKQAGEGARKQFWSVIPAWITSKQRDAKLFSTMKDGSQ